MLETQKLKLLLFIEQKDLITSSHCSKTSDYATKLGNSMGLNNQDQMVLELSALLHDVGKINVPDTILLKPSSLTPEEYEIIKKHSQWGAKIVGKYCHEEEAATLADTILHHHERYDGKGYPSGLKGETIPLFSQIIAVADAYDAMTSNRSYRQAMKMEEAVDILKEESGKQFQPLLVQRFIDFIIPMTFRNSIFAK